MRSALVLFVFGAVASFASAGDRKFAVTNSCTSGQCGFTVVNKTAPVAPPVVSAPGLTGDWWAFDSVNGGVKRVDPPAEFARSTPAAASAASSACVNGSCSAPASPARRGLFFRR